MRFLRKYINLLSMEEILHHLDGINYQPQLVIAGFLNHQQYQQYCKNSLVFATSHDLEAVFWSSWLPGTAVPPLENRPHPIALKGLLGLQLQVGPSINSVVWSAYTTSWGHAVVGSEFPKQPPFGCIKPCKSWDKHG